MKYIKQFTLILTISFIGELLKEILPFPIPASIYGMVLLFLCLETGIIRLPSVEETAKYLIEIMPLMFIPAGVGLLESWGILYPILAKTATIIIISTIIVMAVSGKVTQGVIRCCGHKKTLEADKNE
jgi:Putative effector of murein hydrolase LrgA